MCGSVEAEVEVQRTIKRAELMAFLCFLERVIGPVRIHVDNEGVIDGLRRGESKCLKPRARDADLWIQMWEELHDLTERGILMEVEHVKAHRTKKKRNMCRSLRGLSPKAMRRLMSWQKQKQCWTKGL